MKKLSIIILNYNTKDLLYNCLVSLIKVGKEADIEVIVVDNGSTDGSLKKVGELKAKFKTIKFIQNKDNFGFAKGNNQAKGVVSGEYVLFLNSDTEVKKDAIGKTLEFIDRDRTIGAVTCKLVLPNGKPDRDTRRSFITPWIGLVHLVLKLDYLFPKSKLFAKYWYGYKDENEIHEVDAIQGAFFLTRKKILDSVGWFDEDYFLDAEDIDLSYKIREKGYKIFYFPQVDIIHYKGASKGKIKGIAKQKLSLSEKVRFKLSGVNSMEIFYKKRLWHKYPELVNWMVVLGINVIKYIRFLKAILVG